MAQVAKKDRSKNLLTKPSTAYAISSKRPPIALNFVNARVNCIVVLLSNVILLRYYEIKLIYFTFKFEHSSSPYVSE